MAKTIYEGRADTTEQDRPDDQAGATAPAASKPRVFITPEQRRVYLVQARDWWDKKGRHMVAATFNEERAKPKFRAGTGNAPGIKTTGSREKVLPSGILNGKMFDNLNPRERSQVLKAWLHYYTEFKFPDLTEKDLARAKQKLKIKPATIAEAIKTVH